jgi:membrane protein implicated in regulation of membrane protease activity
VGGLLFVVRLIIMFVGGVDDADGDMDAAHSDADASFKILSLQGLTAFFMMFGLVALALFRQSGTSHGMALAGGVLAGCATVWIIGKIFLGMKRLQSDGTLKMENAVGKTGTAYLRIPAGGTGKAEIVVQGQLRVFDAVSDDHEEIPSGAKIEVVRLGGSDSVVVKKVPAGTSM